MSKRDSYAVRISGLADGVHEFSFELNQEFFASLEQSELEQGEVKARIVLEKKPGLFTLHFNLAGKVEVVCDRCLEPFMTGIDTTQTLFVNMGDTPGEIEDDVIMIHKDDHEIEVGQYMYEFIILALPYKRIHPNDMKSAPVCNPEMIKRLNDYGGNQDKREETDPRWDALKGILRK